MSLQLILSSCLLGLVAALVPPPDAGQYVELYFEHFIGHYRKEYADEHEKQARLQIFKDNLEKVIKMNEESEHANYGITKFMDLTKEEVIGRYTGLKASIGDDDELCKLLVDKDIPDVDVPESFDWRDHDAVTPVKNQGGNCGSCWAFSSTGNIEGQVAIKHKEHVELSEQQLVDCDKISHGCNGGLMSLAFNLDLHYLTGESKYSTYESWLETRIFGKGTVYFVSNFLSDRSSKWEESSPKLTTHILDVMKDKVKIKLTDCHSYNLTSQEKVKKLLVKTGPIAIGIAADNIIFYKHGVITDKRCGAEPLDHGVLLVGYGKDEKTNMPYWIVKNSWGTGWGEDGYFRMQRGEKAISCGMMNTGMTMAVIE